MKYPLKRELNKWQFCFCFERDYSSHQFGWKRVEIAFINIHTLPEQGEQLQKKHFNGVYLTFFIWLPIDF